MKSNVFIRFFVNGFGASVAQLVLERNIGNVEVPGSSPGRGFVKYIKEIFQRDLWN